MHLDTELYVNRFATAEPVSVIEIGSRDINGGVRHLFPAASWHGIDLVDGPGVDEVADGATYQPEDSVDLVVCCAVLEHNEDWPDIVRNAARMLKPGGRVVITAAGPDALPRSAVDGMPLRPGEYWAPITADELAAELVAAGFEAVKVEATYHDVRATGTIPDPAAKPAKKRKGQR